MKLPTDLPPSSSARFYKDEHLAWLTLNDKGGVFVTPLMSNRSRDFSFAHLMLIDLTTGEMLYQTPATWYGWPGYWSPTVGRYFENWFFISTAYGDRDQLGQNRLVRLEDSGVVTERMVEGGLAPPLGDGWAFMKERIERDWKVDLYNFESGQLVRMVEVPTQYYVEVEHLHDDVFHVMVAPLYYRDTRRTIYEVRLPTVDIPAPP